MVSVTEQFTFFYGGYGSQWAPSKFTVGGVEYNCGEQFMMAQKAILFNDGDALEIIMGTNNPKVQKAAGRTVRGFDKAIWDKHRKPIVYKGNLAKFTQNKEFRDWLLGTTGTLVEASPYDTIWGIGLVSTDPRAQSRSTWLGSNDLGEIETMVRGDIEDMIAAGIIFP